MIKLKQLDHLVLTVKNIEATVEFYCNVLGMQRIRFAGDRTALKFGSQKINLHLAGMEFEPKATNPAPGSADLCFLTDTPMDGVLAHLQQHKISIEEGPLQRTGASTAILSVYIRDPDGNLIEISNSINSPVKRKGA